MQCGDCGNAQQRLNAGIEISYKGTPVPNAHLCTFRMTNSGKVAITQQEYEPGRNIVVEFGLVKNGSTPKVLIAEVSEKKPEDLSPSITSAQNQVMITPLLLNRGDWFSVRVLLNSKPSRSLTVNARISDIGKIEVSERPSTYSLKTVIAGLTIYTLGVVETVFFAQVLTGVVTVIVGIGVAFASFRWRKLFG